MDVSILTGKLAPLGASLAIGLLIGIERGWSSREAKEGERMAGIRTFGLIGLLGGCIGLISLEFGGLVYGLAFFGLCLLLGAAYAINLLKRENVSITSVIAAILTFTLGSLSTLGYVALAGSAAVVTTALLSIKPVLHGWLKKLEREELYAALKLLLMSVVLLSFLPNQYMGPMAAFNPFEIWWMVVLVALISFAGYFAIKIAGPKKGSFLTAFFAGLISSTALTYEFSKLAKKRKGLTNVLAAGILMACGIMFLRLLLFVSILKPTMLSLLVVPSLLMAVLLFMPSLILYFKMNESGPKDYPSFKNPLELKSALLFGVILVIVIFLSKVLSHYFPQGGIYVLGLIAGLVDVDAFVLPTTRLPEAQVTLKMASIAIMLAAFSNTLLKGVLAMILGPKEMLKKVTLPLIFAVIFGGGVTLLVQYF